MNVPFVQLRELTLDDVEERYQWSLDTEVTKHLVVPDQYPPFTREDTKRWIEACINRKMVMNKSITAENGIHIGWIDLKTLIKQIKMQNWESRLVIKSTGERVWNSSPI